MEAGAAGEGLAVLVEAAAAFGQDRSDRGTLAPGTAVAVGGRIGDFEFRVSAIVVHARSVGDSMVDAGIAFDGLTPADEARLRRHLFLRQVRLRGAGRPPADGAAMGVTGGGPLAVALSVVLAAPSLRAFAAGRLGARVAAERWLLALGVAWAALWLVRSLLAGYGQPAAGPAGNAGSPGDGGDGSAGVPTPGDDAGSPGAARPGRRRGDQPG
jgi:hypothetical protein